MRLTCLSRHAVVAIAAIGLWPMTSGLVHAQPNVVTVIDANSVGTIPVSEVDGVAVVPLSALARFVGGELRERSGAMELTIDGKTAQLASGKSMVALDGRFILLSSHVSHQGDLWYVPVDFLQKVLPYLSRRGVRYRPDERLLVLGREFPRLDIRSERYPAYTRVVVESTTKLPFQIEQAGGQIRVIAQTPFLETDFRNEDLLDGVVESIALVRHDKSYRVTIMLGERFGTMKAFELEHLHRVVLDLFRSRVPVEAVRRNPEVEGPDTFSANLQPIEEREGAGEDTSGEGEQGADGPPEDIETFRLEDPPPPRRTPDVPFPEEARGQLSIVTIDPGHGGAETGAIGRGGLEEKGVTLSISRRLRKILQERLGLRVVLTRDGDRTLDLDDRAAFANSNKSDLFVSIHADASSRSAARGSSVYYLSYPSTEADSRQVAMAQQRPTESKDLRFILWHMAQSSHLNQSARLAEILQEELRSATGEEKIDRGIKQNTFRVLMGATMPAVLVEVGFISNPQEEKRLDTADYQEKLAEAIYRGVLRYKHLYEGTSPVVGGAPRE